MLQSISLYLLIGIVWAFLHETSSIEMDTGKRVRVCLFWPITFIAFVIGFGQALIDRLFGDDE